MMLFFSFSEYEPSAFTNLDTEDAEIRSVSINGSSALLINKRNTITIVWMNDEKYFILSGNIMEGELIKIADNVRLIR